MRGMRMRLEELVRDERGATAVEYAMIIGLIALATFAVYRVVGVRVFDILDFMQLHLKTATRAYDPTTN